MTEGAQDASDDCSNAHWVCLHCGASNEPRYLQCRGCSRRQDFQMDVFTSLSVGYPSSSSSSSRPTRQSRQPSRLSTRSTAAENIRGVDGVDLLLLDNPSNRDGSRGFPRWRRPPQDEVGNEGNEDELNQYLGRPSVHVYRNGTDVLDLLEECQPDVDAVHDMLDVGCITPDTGGHDFGDGPSSSAGFRSPWHKQDRRRGRADTDDLASGDQDDLEDVSARQSEREGSGVADKWSEDSAREEEDPEVLAGEIQDTGRIAARLRGAVAKARYGTNYGNLVLPKPPPAPTRCGPGRPKVLRIPRRDGRDRQKSRHSSSESGGSEDADQSGSASPKYDS